ncbi:MAG: radical SAM protein [Nitrospinae bacterium]|nr:radical SAM protein [Nitrospinota bacterium]
MKIVVANSVGVDRNGFHMVHVPSRWSLGVRNFTNCAYYPWELAYTSSLLKRETPYDVKMLDGVRAAWDFDAYFKRLCAEKPDWLVMESSSRTIAEDLRLAAAAKKEFGTRTILAGQHPMAEPEETLKIADYVCIGEYEYSALDLIRGKDPKTIPGVYPNGRAGLLDIDSLPFPEDEDVRRIDYHEPNCRYRQVQMYASRGCPRRCNFCAAATLYYDELNWRPRNPASVVREIRALKEKYPEMEGVFFDEETHNIRKSFNIALAQAIRAEGLDGLKYEAMCEYASFDEEAFAEMRRAGYYKIRVGVETASDAVAQHMTLGKKHDIAKLRRMLTFGKSLGMTFYGTFSMGGLGSSEEEDQKTADLIGELSGKGLLDEIQVSINTPQPGTDFYRTALKESYLRPAGDWADFDGNGHVVVDYPHYKADRIQSMFQKALSAFDSGKKISARETFMAGAERSFEQIPPDSRVLVLRSVRSWMVLLLVEALKRRQARVDALGQDSVLPELTANPLIDRSYSYGDGFFSARSAPAPLVSQLKENRYDFAVLPMANNHLDGYQNVREVARLIHPKRTLGVYPDGSARFLD